MKKADSGFLLEVLKFEYSQRLTRVLREAEIFDAQGKVIIKPDLKVRHKDSGYEYTVDRVEGSGPGNLQIVLRDPEEPRFEPPPQTDEEVLADVLSEDDLPLVKVSDTDVITQLDDSDPEEEYFIVDEKDFEDNYEVK